MLELILERRDGKLKFGFIMRAFLAIEIEEKIKEVVLKLIEELSSKSSSISWVKREQIHLTLFFFEDLKENDLDEISRNMSKIAQETEPFSLQIQGNGFFGRKENPRVFWLGFDGEIGALKLMQSKIVSSLKDFGYIEDKNFNPHLTIGRNRSGRSQDRIVSMLSDLKDFSAGPFLVKEVVLFKSELLKSGAVHSVVKRFGLGGKY